MGIQAKRHAVSDRSGIKDGPCFSQIDRGEISILGKKIVASAQRIYERSILQQSSISVRKPTYDIADYLRTRLISEMGGRIVNSVAYLEEVLEESFSIPELVEVFRGAFESEIGKSRDIVLAEVY
jgi:lipoate-protein ligase A